MTTYRELKIKEAAGLVSVGDPRTSEALVSTEARQFGAAGSVLDNVPMRVHPAEQLLKYSVLWLDAAHDTAGEQTIQNLGWGGSVLNAQSGSTGSADSNDPKFLDWTGQNYVYLPGVASNFLSVLDEDALDITGDIDIRLQVALDDWTPGAASTLLSKWVSAGNNSWLFWINSSNRLEFRWSTTGSDSIVKPATTDLTVSNFEKLWVRVTLDVNNGASGNDVKFYTSIDGASWYQLGSTITTAGTTNIYATSTGVSVGQFSTALAAGSYYRAQILNGINGTPVLDVDCSQIVSGSDTTFTALTGQTVTINRSTAGRKAVAVVSPVWLFGTDDYMEVADNDLIDIPSAQNATLLVVTRQWNLTAANYPLMAKKSGLTNTADGFLLFTGTTGLLRFGQTSGLAGENSNGPEVTAGSLTVGAGVRSSGNAVVYVNSSSITSASGSGTGAITNSLPLRIGALSTSPGGTDMELIAVAVFRRALTSTEITTLNSYYQSRIGG